MAEIEIVHGQVSLEHLRILASGMFGDLIKAVVDVQLGIMAIGGELHADEEALLLDEGSKQADLWGINLYPADYGGLEWIEFDSMINVRPSSGNRSRAVEDPTICIRIGDLVGRLVKP
ncbi:MAG TPA: DUF5674 family protein [Dehalococcoidia bacterium]